MTMKAAAFPGALLLILACTVAGSGSDDVEMSTLARGAYAATDSRTAVVATSNEEYRRLWQQLIGEGEAAEADFAKGVVVFLLAGSRSTGGWSIEPQSVTIEGTDTAVIVAKIKGPPPGSMVTQALTSPYAVVLVRDPKVRKVRWASE